MLPGSQRLVSLSKIKGYVATLENGNESCRNGKDDTLDEVREQAARSSLGYLGSQTGGTSLIAYLPMQVDPQTPNNPTVPPTKTTSNPPQQTHDSTCSIYTAYIDRLSIQVQKASIM